MLAEKDLHPADQPALPARKGATIQPLAAAPPVVAHPESKESWLKVSLPGATADDAERSWQFSLRPDHWERLQIDLPADWTGQGLRLEPGGSLALLEIAGVRIVSRVMDEPVWELLGRELVAGFQATPATQLVSSEHRLRLLVAEDDAQLWLPEIRLPVAEEPLVLEVGARVRTGLPQITHVLQAWVKEADTRRLALEEENTALGEDRDRHVTMAREYLSAVEMARQDGDQREAALREQLASAQAAAAQHAATLMGEIDAARQDGNQREAALREQLASARQDAETHASVLLREIDAARQDGDQREAALREQLASAQAAAAQHAATLTGEIDAARQNGDQREAALREQLASAQAAAAQHASVLTTEIENARAHGEQRVADVTGQLERHLRESSAMQSHFLRQSEQALAELAAERAENAANQGRVRSMRRSFSWRVTLPLRALGRLLTGRKTRETGPK